MTVIKGDRNVRALVDLFVAVVFICFLQQYSQLPRVFNNIKWTIYSRNKKDCLNRLKWIACG